MVPNQVKRSFRLHQQIHLLLAKKANGRNLYKFNDKSGRVLILEVKIENEVLLLINLYNANTENEQLSTLSDLSNMLEKIDDINNKSIVFGGDFNLFFEVKLEAQGGNPVLEKSLQQN